MSRSPYRVLRVLATAAAVLASTAAFAASSAVAAPVVVNQTAGNGDVRTVQLSHDRYQAGAWVEVRGSGFTPDMPDTATRAGAPLVAVRLNKGPTRLQHDGPSAHAGSHLPQFAWFRVGENGSFEGRVRLPDDLPKTGIGTGSNAGKHSLIFLGGTWSTVAPGGTVTPETVDPAANPEAFFTSASLELGITDSVGTYGARSSFPAAATNVTVTGAGFHASAPVTFRIDDSTTTLAPVSSVATNASGEFRAVVPVPMLAPGLHVLRASTGDFEASTTFTVVPPAATITSTSHLPGSVVTFAVTGFVRNDGTGGQKVGVRIANERAILACVQADADGTGTGSVALPATIAPGSYQLQFLAGTSCVSTADGGQPDDLPARTLFGSFTVDAAPVVPQPPAEEKPADTPPVTQKPAAVKPRFAAALAVIARGTQLRVVLPAGPRQRVSVAARTATKVVVRPGARPAFVAIAKPLVTTVAAGRKAIVLKLTPVGKALLARRGALRVTVRVTRPGTRIVTARTFTLRD